MPCVEEHMREVSRVLVLAAALAAASCAAGLNHQPPILSTMPVSYEYGREIAGDDAATRNAEWWEGFHDVLLSEIIRRTLAQNLDLAQTAARMEEARAAAAGAGAALRPSADLQSAASRTQDSLLSPIGEIAHAVGAPRDYDTHSVLAEASWETDLFGGLRRRREAAFADAQAANVARIASRLAVTAEAADAYLDLRGLQAQLLLTRSQEKNQAQLVEMVRALLGQGLASDRDVQKARAELERVNLAMPSLTARIDAQIYRLDLLMGSTAGTHRAELTTNSGIQPAAPPPMGSAAPAELLRRRPDIVLAERQLAGADARIAAALSEYYPHLAFSGVVGFEVRGTGPLFPSDALEATGLIGLRWRLFDFNRIDAEVAIARSRAALALAAYRASVLRATGDVESALSRYVASRSECVILGREIEALANSRAQALDAYRMGAVALIEVLNADRDLLAAKERFVMANSDEARAAVASFRALGGGWTK